MPGWPRGGARAGRVRCPGCFAAACAVLPLAVPVRVMAGASGRRGDRACGRVGAFAQDTNAARPGWIFPLSLPSKQNTLACPRRARSAWRGDAPIVLIRGRRRRKPGRLRLPHKSPHPSSHRRDAWPGGNVSGRPPMRGNFRRRDPGEPTQVQAPRASLRRCAAVSHDVGRAVEHRNR